MTHVEPSMGFFGSSVGCLTGLFIFLWQITLLGSAGPPPAPLAVGAALPVGWIFLLSISPLGYSFPGFVAFLLHSLLSPSLNSHTSSVSCDISA